MKIPFPTLALPVILVLSGCSEVHPSAPPSDGAAADAAPPSEASTADATAPSDGAHPDAGSDDPLFAPCPPDFVDEGDACVAWRGIPAPPCPPVSLARMDDSSVAVRCGAGALYALTPTSTWEHVDGAFVPLVPEDDGPWEGLGPHIAVTFPDGSRVGTHGDVYAHPAAWRTDETGAWRETVPPPSAFVTHGAWISDREAVFVGRDAFVVTVIRRVHLGW